MTQHPPETLQVNARSYHWPRRPAVVLCLDGCAPA